MIFLTGGLLFPAVIGGPPAACVACNRAVNPNPEILPRLAEVAQMPPAQPAPALPPQEPAPSPEAPRINRFGRTVELAVPLRLNGTLSGTVPLRIGADDSLAIPKVALIEAFSRAGEAALAARLSELADVAGYLDFPTLATAGLRARYDPALVEVQMDLPGTELAERSIAVAGIRSQVEGTFEAPARTSGYLNIRTALGYDVVRGGSDGLVPLIDMSGAVRIRDVVVESDFSADFGGQAGVFRRAFTRAVYDRPDLDLRFSAGDVFAIAQGSISLPDVLGIGVERQNRLFDPQRNLQTRTIQTFALSDPSQVEIVINGNTVRRLTLAPGNYRLSDFPFVTGGNDVQIIATDAFGRREVAAFSRFFNFSLLAQGQTELSAAAGFRAQQGSAVREYDFSRPAAYGSYRRGITEMFTLGGTIAGDPDTQVIGAQATLGMPLGTMQFEGAVSNDSIVGVGFQARAFYSYTPFSQRGIFGGASLSADFTSQSFSFVGREFPALNTIAANFSANANFRLTERDNFSLSANYSANRLGRSDRLELAVRYGRRLDRATNFTASVGYGQGFFGDGNGLQFQVGITRRFGPRGFGSARYSNRDDTTRLTYNRAGGRGVGATNINAGLDISPDSVSGGGGIFYLANRAEIGVAHGTNYNLAGNEITGSRTTVQLATSIQFADGTFALGRPVTEGFAIVRGHPTLEGADIYIDRDNEGYLSKSGALGPASVAQLGAYSERTITVEVPDAPTGYDVGAGAYRVRPPYRAGYLFTVGSDYTKTAFGTLMDNGRPLGLVTGVAREIDAKGEPRKIELFTNRVGRFGLSGLAPGRWEIVTATQPPLTYVLEIPADGENLIRLGEIEPQ
ncbi:MAG: hypothetical protein GC147_12825 [Porphyrobacter sp.]|nr:hypothetical protein [Porphyrobacter sp.]